MSNRLIVTPESEAVWHELRAQDVTSTESAALFGMSPYGTAFELWHRKKDGKVVTIEATGRMAWGIRLQDAIARGIAEDYGVKVRRMNAYQRLVDCHMGSSFDFEIIGIVDGWDGRGRDKDATLRVMYETHGTGNLEIKNVDSLVFRDQWIVEEDKSLTAPDHIEIQVQHQLHVSERNWSAIGVLVGGNAPKLLIRERQIDVGQAIEKRVRQFWASIEANQPPPPEFPEDAEFVCKLYSYAEPGKLFDGRGNADLATLAQNYQRASDDAKKADEDKKIAKAKLLEAIGDAEKALLDGFTISAGIVGPAEVSYTRQAYRNFRCTAKKAKAA